MMDIYDQAVEFLTHQSKYAIHDAWGAPNTFPGGSLFAFSDFERNGECGCLTQIRSGQDIGPTVELTEQIRSDDRLPTSGDAITVEMLPVFAEWQRKLDAELGRPTPEKI